VEIPHEQPLEPTVYKEIRPGKTRPATNIRHSKPPKRRGEEGELAFMRRAIAEGFAIAKPWGDSERYDFILDNGTRLWRVQVRSTDREAHHGFAVHSYVLVNRKIAQLTAKDVDVIAAYLVPKDLWYIVPIEACTCKNLWFYPGGSRKGSRFEKFREAWDYLRAPVSGEILI
jgi:hypothetical protein